MRFERFEESTFNTKKNWEMQALMEVNGEYVLGKIVSKDEKIKAYSNEGEGLEKSEIKFYMSLD